MKIYDFNGKVIYDDPTLQEKTATENGEVVADSGYDGLSKVTVNVENQAEIYDGSHVVYTKLHEFFSKQNGDIVEKPYVRVLVDKSRYCDVCFAKTVVTDDTTIKGTYTDKTTQFRLTKVPTTVEELISEIINTVDDDVGWDMGMNTEKVIDNTEDKYYSCQVICTNFDHNLVGTVATLRFDE